MFRDMIGRCSELWYKSDDCKINEIISYIQVRGALRDAQVEAVKVYLFLKIACNNKPLSELFINGRFNTLDLDEEEIKSSTRQYLTENPGAAALYEFCKDSKGPQTSNSDVNKILDRLKSHPETVDYVRFFNEAFYNISYSDYLFSLPMGAGKTFLMSAFIYLDLYFTETDRDNEAFAQNFIVLAPSGLKNSIVPSLKTIRNFDPTWVLPKNDAERIRNEIVFETLDSDSSAQNSNRVKDPNSHKVALYLKRSMRGVVFVTNAEKVILSKIKKNQGKGTSQSKLDDNRLYDMSNEFNELRYLIGLIPHLSIFIDEVHHASDASIRLRQVVTEWATNGTVISVIGFSGTPYLQKAEKIQITDGINFSSQEINNVVYYYPLINGIGNFLKVPSVKQYENRENYTEIVEDGLRGFFETNLNKRYGNGTISKIAVYCNSIEELENEVYATAAKIANEFGLNPNDAILKYHESTKEYKLALDAKMEFAALDDPLSAIRIILLVQIGKEGWDCKSLTGVVLAKENKSTRNMVLQTCCRCLRQVQKYDYDEKAFIYLCKTNAEILESQLKSEQRITLQDFQKGSSKPTVPIDIYNREWVVELPQIDFYQLSVEFETVFEDTVEYDANINSIPLEDVIVLRQTVTKDFENRVLERSLEDVEHGVENGDLATFGTWLGMISKESYGFVSSADLHKHETELKKIFDTITVESEGHSYYSSKFEQPTIRSMIRKAFYTKRSIRTIEQYLPCDKDLLIISDFKTHEEAGDPDRYYPNQDVVHQTMVEDQKGLDELALMHRRYHYMPYHFDSGFEMEVLKYIQDLSIVKNSDLEVYYIGNRFLTDFRIKCYEAIGSRMRFIGLYTPDILVLNRRNGKIHKTLIVETKGRIYANDPIFKKKKNYIEQFFMKNNNEHYKYERFQYLYLEDTMGKDALSKDIVKAIADFFGCEINGN